jgi:hypothetical protein
VNEDKDIAISNLISSLDVLRGNFFDKPFLVFSHLPSSPTYPQRELTFILDDYGKKGSITFRFSGGDTPSAGTGC